MDYYEFIKTTDLSNHNLQFYLDGMTEEGGEVAGIFKRMRRGDYGDSVKYAVEDHGCMIKSVINNFDQVKQDLIKEVGDLHWYTTRLLQEIGVTWEEVEKVNLEKLLKRKDKGLLMGKGDNRENKV